MSFHHSVTIRSERSKCGTSGHFDTVAECSCGEFEHRIGHGGDVSRFITAHRLDVLEQVAGITTTIERRRS